MDSKSAESAEVHVFYFHRAKIFPASCLVMTHPPHGPVFETSGELGDFEVWRSCERSVFAVGFSCQLVAVLEYLILIRLLRSYTAIRFHGFHRFSQFLWIFSEEVHFCRCNDPFGTISHCLLVFVISPPMNICWPVDSPGWPDARSVQHSAFRLKTMV